MSVHPADPLPEEGSPTDAGPQDESSSDAPTSQPDATLEAEASELPFGADQPGFTDWRVELRERLKRIRARRESAEEQAEAADSVPPEEAIDQSEVPTLDDVDLDSGDVDGIAQEETAPELDKTFEQPAEESTVELSDDPGAPDLPLQKDAVDEATDTVELTGQTETTAVDDPAADLEELLENEQPAETATELIDEMITDGRDTDSSAAETPGKTAATVAGAIGEAAATGKAAAGWDEDLIADLHARSAKPPAIDPVVEALDPLTDRELTSSEPPHWPEEGQESGEEPLIATDEVVPDETEPVDPAIDASWESDDDAERLEDDASEEGVEGATPVEALDPAAPGEESGDAILMEDVDEGATEGTIEESSEDASEETAEQAVVDDVLLDEILLDPDEAPSVMSGEGESTAALEDAGGAAGDEAVETESADIQEIETQDAEAEEAETEAAETDPAVLVFDGAGEAVPEAAPDLELDIEEAPDSDGDAGLEWDTPAPPELLRPATSGLDRSAAPLGQRAVAGIADALFLVIIAGVLVWTASAATDATYDALLTDAMLPLAMAWGIFAIGYLVFFTGTCGQTIGKMIMKMRVVSTDQLSVGFGRATKRLVASVPSILVLGLGFFLALRDPKRRTVYDRIAQTRVVKA